MQEWLKISLILCIFGFLKEIRPSEPFIYEFLIDRRWRNVTDEEVTQQVYPAGTYSYLAHLVLVFLITDLCRYKPLIILLGASGIVIWSLLLWTKTLFYLLIVEALYGTFCATEVAYYSYIYTKVKTEYYQKVTSHTRAAILAGRAISGILAQLLISFDLMNYRDLNYITLAAMILATAWSLFLPTSKKSIYFHPEEEVSKPLSRKVTDAFTLMATHFKTSFTNGYVVKWSLWYALATCGFVQVQTYMQPLWTAIVNDPSKPIYNGAVEAVLTVIGFLGALVAGFLKTDWKIKGELCLTICSLFQGFIILFASRTNHVFWAYVCYVLFGGMYHFMITVTCSEIAKCIEDDSYGLVFGVNTFIAVVFQTILTAVVVTEGVGFALKPRDQYFVYGCVHIVIAALFICIGLAVWMKRSKDYKKAIILENGR
ncbi:thiamine transporter 2-like [Diabrotica virgifera virgifera]|uniref:Thiamine transporter 1-like n=1 Tax=Diabrotica virgifera virgifera TaxID=50390 RepID=A0ABM5JMZ5_DIAVI|nr:thiamine transporter 2-like [Diabrotica virgifera virgifera]